MIKVTVIKSAAKCMTCGETEMIVQEISKSFPTDVEFSVCIAGTKEASIFGVVTTPVVAIDNKIYSMGKPVIKQKVEGWIKKELGQ